MLQISNCCENRKAALMKAMEYDKDHGDHEVQIRIDPIENGLYHISYSVLDEEEETE